jgi:hypothetical protein
MRVLPGLKDAWEDTSIANRLRLVLVEQSENLEQRIDLRDWIVSASKPLTEISACHPLRDADDLLIDFEFKTSQQRVSHPPHHPSLPLKKGV